MRIRTNPHRSCLFASLSVLALAACGGSQPPAPAAPVASAPLVPPVTSAAPPASAAAPVAAAPSPEEEKKAKAARELQEDRTKWEDENKTEVARWTPELHAAVKALADKAYPSGRAALQATIAGKHRKPGNADRDKYRHPLETLEFFGFRPTLTVLDVGPGEGWYEELLAPALSAKGKLLTTTTDPNGPPDQRSTFYGQRYKSFLDKAPELYGKVQTIIVDNKGPSLGLDGTVDLVILMRETHGMVNSGTLSAWLTSISKALKPGGVLGIEEHRAKPDADPVESSKKGYVPEKWLIDQVEAAGFKLAGKSEVNANPKDTKDYPEGVWALPPSFSLESKDHDKYAAIGESDRMTLKFVKAPAPKAAAPAPAKPAAPAKP
jgi:predicted methyltransferase